MLLKSAGIVGLAGAIMAVVSSNALFVDPGGPDRPSLRSTIDDNQIATPTVIAASMQAAGQPADDEIAALLPKLAELKPVELEPVAQETVEQETLPPPEAQPETTASVIPAERVTPPTPMPQPTPAVAAATVASIAVASAPQMIPATPASPSTDAPRTAFVSEASPASVTPTASTPEPATQEAAAVVKPDDIPAPTKIAAEEKPTETVSALWPKDSVECPVDWLAVPNADDEPSASGDCHTIDSLVQSAGGDTASLRKALPEDVLDLVALAPSIPIPGANADPNEGPQAAAAEQQSADEEQQQASAEPEAQVKPEPAPKPARTARRNSDWPDAPPPNCGSGKHAFWHFTDRTAHTKEWYCK